MQAPQRQFVDAYACTCAVQKGHCAEFQTAVYGQGRPFRASRTDVLRSAGCCTDHHSCSSPIQHRSRPLSVTITQNTAPYDKRLHAQRALVLKVILHSP